jgi:hypothetical protein
LSLQINIRVRNNPSKLDFISWISSLPYDPTLNGQITLLSFVQQAPLITDLINHVYLRERLLQATYNYQAFHGRAILSTLNNTVRKLNTTILDTFPSKDQTYLAVDSADINKADPEIAELPPKVLQNICLPGLSFSKLQLKVSAPVMLLRNLCPQEGLCNRSRMLIYSLRRFLV